MILTFYIKFLCPVCIERADFRKFSRGNGGLDRMYLFISGNIRNRTPSTGTKTQVRDGVCTKVRYIINCYKRVQIYENEDKKESGYFKKTIRFNGLMSR